MKDLYCLKYLLEENNFLCKIDLKDVYFSVLLCMTSTKFGRFPWLGNLNAFPCLRFGLGSVSKILSKLLMIPIALLKWLNIRLAIYLDVIFSDGKNVRGNFNKQIHFDFSASASEFCHKSEKISSETVPPNRNFRPKTRYPHHELGTNIEKDGKGDF